MAGRALERRLSEMAARLSACRQAEGIAREVLSTSADLLGVTDGALYIPSDSPQALWERVGSGGRPCPQTVTPPAEFVQELERRGALHAVDDVLRDEVPPSVEEGFGKLLKSFLGGLLVPLVAGSRLEAVLLLGPPQDCFSLEAEERDGVASMAQQAAVAFCNARLRGELEHLREELDRKVLQLLTLFEVGREIHSFANWDLLTKNILYTAMGNLGIREGALLAPQRTGEPFRIWHFRGMPLESLVDSFRLRPQGPLVEHLGKVRRAVERSEVEKSFPHDVILKLAFEVLLPGISSHRLEFVLLLGTKLSGKALSADEMEYLMILCGQAAVVFDNQELVRQDIERERLAAVGEALAGLSHDLRGILHGFDGASRHLGKLVDQLCDGQVVDVDKLGKWWGLLCSNQKRLTDLAEDVLEYSRRREPVRETCQLNDLVRELVRQRQEELSRRKIEVHLDLAPSLPTFEADTTRLFRALANLLENACDAVSADTGRIELRTRMQPDVVTVEVKDNGDGIAPEHLPRLFDPLFTTKKGSEGTGFGLANVKKIVEEHRGRVQVSSRPGMGSVFRIEIPLTDSSRRLEAAARQQVSDEKV